MRFSTVFVSSAIVLAGMSAALPIEREDTLVARFVDSDFLDEIDARSFDEELELYARGGALSKISGGKKDNPPSYRSASRDRPPAYQPSPNHPPPLPDFRRETDYSNNHKSATGHNRRSYYADDYELMARGNSQSRVSGHSGDKERKDGKPPKYKVAAKDPPPHYEHPPHYVPSEHFPPPLGPFLTDHHSVHSNQGHRRSFEDLD